MNYLAHLRLSRECPESMVGGILGDFLKGVERSAYPEKIQAGIQLHLSIDGFADAHPAFHRSRKRFQPPFRRYAGVLVDVFYDHFLARDWLRYSPEVPLEDFAQRAYAALAEHEEILPPRMRRMLPRMVQEDWLTSYRSLGGIDRTLTRLARRLTHENPLPEAVSQLEQHYEGLGSDFACFFPDALRFAESIGTRARTATET